MTKTELDILAAHLRKALITDNKRYLGWQDDEFKEGWYGAVSDMEIEIENIKEDSPDLEDGKIQKLIEHLKESRADYMGSKDDYNIYDVCESNGYDDCYREIMAWLEEIKKDR